MSELKQENNNRWLESLRTLGISTRKTLRIMSYNKVGFFGFLLLVFIIVFSYIGPIFIELDTDTKIDQIYHTPSAEHWLGTDHQGRDIFSQIVHGGRDVIAVGLAAGAISTLIGVTFGTLAGFVGGRLDSVIIAITDFVLTVPRFPLLVVLAAIVTFDRNVYLGVILGLLNWPALLRAVRSQALSLKERDFVAAARALDLGTPHIIFREIVPNMMSYIIISFTLAMTGAIYALVGLVLLGLAPFSGTNWGIMLSLAYTRGAMFFGDSIWYIMSPVVAIAILQLALITTNRSLELIFNPRLRTEA
ncbi:MAG: ABC transporter permease [Anaerolineales bacterium]|nr:ABC transporter permease [Anaerolineales bacterium]